MIQISTTDGNEGGLLADTISEIINKSNNLKNNNLALSFALIIYDFEAPHIRKLLTDDFYMDALDKLSGKHISIFYVNSNYVREQARRSETIIRLTMSVEQIDNNSNFSAKEIGRELINTKKLPSPSVLFFSIKDDKIKDYTIARLRENEIEKAFNELKKIIEISIDSISKVKVEFRNNDQEIFRLIKNAIDSSEFWKNTSDLYKKIIKVKQFLSFFRL
ncbi:MAG: hypothetical protein M9897_07665 [Brumimicrobium sp.]|nr:hypothetical protein [Brumimicrobium sp.]